jgi:outer membrane receptor protein involved in Fe transport
MRSRAVVCASLLLMVAVTITAQETTGSIIGTVTSQDGVTLPGVSIEVDDLERGLKRVTSSGHRGDYIVAALPPARYQLTASLEGFRTFKRSVHVELGRTAGLDIEMQIGAFSDQIEVVADAPLLDLTSTVPGLTVDADELLSRVPVQREVTQIALLAPGTFPADHFWQEPGRMGMHTPGQGFISFSGSSYGENSYQVNGLNITNFRKFMGSTFVPMEFVDEVQVKSGGYEAEFGRATGGVINMVTKSGTNTLRGGLSAYWQPENLQEQEPNTEWDLNLGESRDSLEANASVGGPILRDRLFFFGFVRYSDFSFKDIYTGLHTDVHETSTPYWGGKLDWNMTASHHLEGTYISDAVDVTFTRVWDPEPETVYTGIRRRGGDNFIFKYTGVLDDNFLISVQAGRNDFDRTNYSNGDECPVVVDARTGQSEESGCAVFVSRISGDDRRSAYRVDLDWFVGSHSLRAGADYELNVSHAVEEYSGGAYYNYFLNGAPDQDPEEYFFPDLPWDQDLASQEIYSLGGSFDTNSSAAYVQNSWSITPRLTLNLGLRWERYENKNGAGGTFIETNNQWAPRLGAIWDPSGAGRSKLYASFGTYHLPASSQASIWLAGGVTDMQTLYTFDGTLAADGSPVELGDELGRIVRADGKTPDPRETVSANIDPMSQNELIVGYERQLGADWSVGVRGVARWYHQVIEDFTILEGLWNTYGVGCLNPDLIETGDYCWENGWRLGNPGRDFVGWYDLDRDGELDRVHIPAEELGLPAAKRDYYALELTFDRRFTDRWMLHGSYTWSHLYGNYEGSISDEWPNYLIANDWAGVTQAFDWPYMMEHSSGDLPNDMRHNFKLYGAYMWDFGFQVGGNFSFYTGRPINSYGRHPSDPWAPYGDSPAFYTGGEPRPRGCCGRTDNVWGLDLMLKYDFRLAGMDCNLRLDAFNALNNQNVVRVEVVAENRRTGVPREYHGEPRYYQPPRTVRLGFGLSF